MFLESFDRDQYDFTELPKQFCWAFNRQTKCQIPWPSLTSHFFAMLSSWWCLKSNQISVCLAHAALCVISFTWIINTRWNYFIHRWMDILTIWYDPLRRVKTLGKKFIVDFLMVEMQLNENDWNFYLKRFLLLISMINALPFYYSECDQQIR